MLKTEKVKKGSIENIEDSKIYELGFHLIPLLAEENLAAEVTEIKTVIEKHGGVFVSEDFPKNINLAYEMEKVIDGKKYKFKKAYFGWIKFEIDKNVLSDLKEAFEKNENILRFLLIKTVAENTLASQRKIYSPAAGKGKDESTKGQSAEPISAEELDKTIDELVIK